MAVVAKSALERTLRLDAEFFKDDFTSALLALSRHNLEPLTDTAKVSDGNHFTISDCYAEEGIPYYRGQDISGTFFAEQANATFITQEAYQRPYMRRSHLQKGDVLLSIVGTIGSVCLFDSGDEATCSCKLAILRPKSILPEYLAAYLSSSFGQNRIRQMTRGALQGGLTLVDMDQFDIPRFGEFEEAVARTIQEAKAQTIAATLAQQTAEATLTQALGLGGWSPPEPLTYTRSAAAVLQSARLDSQYYMPAKFQTIDALQAISSQTLGMVFDSVRDMVNPASGIPTDLVRNYDLTDALQPILDDGMEPVTLAEIGSQKKRLHDGDLAVSRLRSYLREIAVVRAGDAYPKVGSSEFFVLRPKAGAPFTLSPETLMIWLRSAPVQIILKWCQDGSQHPRFSEGDLLSIPLPDQLADIDAQITSLVQSGLEAKAQSASLLTTAKRAVEIAIEESEGVALAFLEAGRLAQ